MSFPVFSILKKKTISSLWTEFFNGDAGGSQSEDIDASGTLDHITSGGGTGYNAQWENMHFTYIPVTGNFIFTVHVKAIVPGSFDGNDAGAGILCRSLIDSTVKPPQVGQFKMYDDDSNAWQNMESQYNTTNGGSTSRSASAETTYTWMRLEREGDTFYLYRDTEADAGASFTLWKTHVLTGIMPPTMYLGLFTNAMDDANDMPVEFDNITLTLVAGSAKLGVETVGGSRYAATFIRGESIIADGSGQINSISFYYDPNSATGTAYVGVYADNSDTPVGGALLGSGTDSIQASEGWHTINLSSPVSVTFGTKYWLAFLVPTPARWAYAAVAGGFPQYSSASAQTDLPATCPAVTTENSQTSQYANLTY